MTTPTHWFIQLQQQLEYLFHSLEEEEKETAILRMRCHKNGRGIRSVPDKEVKQENLD